MQQTTFPVIDLVATGQNIVRLRKERGLTVKDLQRYFGFEEPQAIYKWQRGESLPCVDNLYALGALLDVPMDEILVAATPKLNILLCEQQAGPAALFFLLLLYLISFSLSLNSQFRGNHLCIDLVQVRCQRRN